MKFKSLVAVSCLALSGITPTIAEETTYGIGAAVFNSGGFESFNSSTIYFPINTGNLLIEPYISMSNYEDSYKSVSGSTNYDYETMEVGVGVFKKEIVTNNVSMYYGARVGLVSYDNTYTYTSSKDSYKQDGYSITPTIGMQYHFNQHFSLGLDVGYQFLDLSGENKSTTSTTTDIETTSQSTVSNILLRYHF